MPENTSSRDDLNIFIDFQIIKDSRIDSLSKELDILIAAGKQIHVWSKTVPPIQMAKYCKSVKINTPAAELDIHTKVWNLRHKERKTLGDIATVLNIPVNKVSYYSKVSPNRTWCLSDWIVSYENKDSNIYPKVDILVDNDNKLVERFKRAGRKAHLVAKV